MEQHDTQSLNGIPGLSQIPILKYLLSQKNTDVTDSEIVFAVIPHIVRRRDLSEFNGRTLDVGIATSIHLRHAPETIADRQSGEGSETLPAAKSPDETSAALQMQSRLPEMQPSPSTWCYLARRMCALFLASEL